MSRPIRRSRVLAWCAATVLVGLPLADARGQEAPAVVDGLVGSWVGQGTLLGRAASFEMTWSRADDGFLRLFFRNGFVGDGGEVTPVLAAEATYLVSGSEAVGVWVDTRPQQLTLSATLTDSTIVTEWIAPSERGRTEYVVRSRDEVVVRDQVRAEDGYRLFAEATYTRTRPGR